MLQAEAVQPRITPICADKRGHALTIDRSKGRWRGHWQCSGVGLRRLSGKPDEGKEKGTALIPERQRGRRKESGRSPQWSVLPFGSRGNQVRFQDARGHSIFVVPAVSSALDWAVIRDTFTKCNRRARAGEDGGPRHKSVANLRLVLRHRGRGPDGDWPACCIRSTFRQGMSQKSHAA